MGKKRGWFSVVKKVLSPESKKDQETPKLKRKWLGKGKDLGPVSSPEETEVTASSPLSPPIEDVKLTEAENEESKHAYSVALATAMAAKAAVAAAQAAAEVVRLTSLPNYPGKSREEIAAIKIQTAFRGYLETPKSKRKWLGKGKDVGPVSLPEETEVTSPPPVPPPIGDVKLTEAENEQSKHAYSVALATAMAADAAVAAAQAAAEVVRLTSLPCYPGKSKEEIAAIKIQAAFRGYLARRALRALRGLVRLKSLIQGQSVKRQATTTLRCMQTLAHVQSQIRARRLRMSEENQALQRQLQQKREKELEKLRASMGEDWNDSTKSKEQIEARQQNKQEAAMRRERALGYALSHQQSWKNSSKSVNQTFMDQNIPHWGWSWLERWMAARPWEIRSTTDNNDRGSVKSMGARSMSIGEISRAYPRSPKSSRSRSRQSHSTPPPKAPSVSSVSSKIRVPSTRGSQRGGDQDSRSMLSVQSDRQRRHSIAGLSMRDDESLASSPAVPSYKASTRPTKVRSPLPSPLGLKKNGTPERGPAGSAKTRLAFPVSPGMNRRHWSS